MKNGLKNAALVLLTLATVGLAGKVINDSTGFVDKLIGKKPDSANYLQVGDELLGKTVYFDMPAFVEDYGDYSGTLTFGTLSYEGEAKTGGATITPVFNYVSHSKAMQLGVTYGPTDDCFVVQTDSTEVSSYTFAKKLYLELSGGSFSAEVTSLTIETLNEDIDLNCYFSYTEDGTSAWKTYRKKHPFVKEEGSSETSSEAGQTSDQGSEKEVQEKARTATYAHEVVPGEDTDARFGAFC